ncbi:MAG: tetratricopeptide repeat protein [Gammaproteobacteria bacterium]|nr:tetratricopeptide repeat protein [Gammaproteobacteria bacterium]
MMRFQPDPEESPISRRTIHLSKQKRSEGDEEKGKAYIEQVADIVRKYPDCRYSAMLAKSVIYYKRHDAFSLKEKEKFLRIIIDHGSMLMVEEARLKLAKLIADQERHAEARELVSDSKSVINGNMRYRMRSVLRDLGEITFPNDIEGWKRLGKKERIALAEHRFSGTYGINRIIRQEGSHIVKAIEEYYEALAAEDAVRLGAAAGLGVEEAESMLKKMRRKRGRADRKRAAMIFPQSSLENMELDMNRWRAGVYRVIIKDINEVLETEDGKRTIRRIRHKGRLKRVSPGKWIVLVPEP